MGAGKTLIVELPEDAKPQSATATAGDLKLESKGTVASKAVTFANLLPETRYDLKISLDDGTVLHGVDLGWHGPEPARPDAQALDEDDRKQIDELFQGIKGFENKRNLLRIAGTHDRATVLAELIRDTAFHSDTGGEIIWRIELWYFQNQHGGWEKVQQASRILRRERFTSRQELLKETRRLRWIPELGGIRLNKDEPPRNLTIKKEQIEAASVGMAQPPPHANQDQFVFHHENILGTSLELIVTSATADQAQAVEGIVLAEIERLRRILSTYDPDSEISRLNRATGTMRCSPELIEVLKAYETWHANSGGAYSGQVGELTRLWHEAEGRNLPPDAAQLARVVRQIATPGWRIDEARQTVTRLNDQALNVDSLGKGYIIAHAVAKAKTQVTDVEGILLNIGGDIRLTGPAAWRLGVADPHRSQDNALPLTQLLVTDAAVATSGSYQRGYRIAGQWHSHLLDPRTGHPANAVASATVIAPDNLTANALATTLCVLSPAEGLQLVNSTPGAACLIIAADGQQFRSQTFAAAETPAKKDAKDKTGGWPNDYQVTLTLTLKKPTRKTHRPYVALWIENAQGKRLRTLAVWGNEYKYFKELPAWWKLARNQPNQVKAITRATRPAGRYQLTWDGLDDAGRAVEPGTYAIVVEVNREKGVYSKRTGSIVCKDEKSTGTAAESVEFEEVQLIYGPPENP
jgi:thiamine biosynthesis lipoprotein ApbE